MAADRVVSLTTVGVSLLTKVSGEKAEKPMERRMDYFDELDFEAIVYSAGIAGMAEEELREDGRLRTGDYSDRWEESCTDDIQAEEPLNFEEYGADDAEPYEETDCDSCPNASGDSPESSSSCKYRAYRYSAPILEVGALKAFQMTSVAMDRFWAR